MGRLSSIVVFALVLLISEQIRGDDLSEDQQVPQIKVTDVKVSYINPKYSKTLVFEVQKHNATYNFIHMLWDIIVDLPEDIYFHVTVFASDRDYEKQELLYKNDIPICAESLDREKLPKLPILPVEKLGGKCLKQGTHMFDNIGHFHFDEIIPDIHNISDYHYTVLCMASKDEIINNVTFYSEWGYLFMA